MTENSGEIQAVFDLFSGTVSSTPGIREQAENQLKLVNYNARIIILLKLSSCIILYFY